jgi:hypothetical protein
MSTDETVPALTGTQLLALVVLMAEARELTNNELKELAGFSLTGADNKKLNALGLVATDKSHRPFSHELTDEGWAVVRAVRTPPARSGSAHKSLVTLLANLDRALTGTSSHAMFFSRTKTTEPAVAEETDLEAQIRLTYEKLAPAPGDWVGLADLRDHLGGADPEDVDRALRVLARQDGVRIIPVANSKALEPRDRAAALRIGDEDNHVLAIDQA